MGLTFSSTSQQTTPLLQPAIAGDSASIKAAVGRHIASYENTEPITSEYDPKLQSYINLPGDSEGNTPLIGAAFGDHLDIVTFLVEKCGADITIKNKMGCSPIWVAAGYGNISVLKFLINHVIAKEDTKIVKILLEENNTGDSPFLAAVSKGHIDAAQLLFEAIQRCTENSAVNENNNQPWKMLCAKNKAGDTPLSVAVGAGFEDKCLIYLLDKEESCISTLKIGEEELRDRPLNTQNSKSLTPLMVACERNNVIIVKELIKRGAAISNDSNGRSPLAVASFCGCHDVVEYLLSLEVGKKMINQNDSNSCTPLWLAARTGDVKMLKMLITAGADVSMKDAKGLLTARGVAEKYKKDKVVEYFKQTEDTAA